MESLRSPHSWALLEVRSGHIAGIDLYFLNGSFAAKAEVEQLCFKNAIVIPKRYNYGWATTQLAAVGMPLLNRLLSKH